MAETYYLTTTASDLSVPGDEYDNEISRTAPGTTTLSNTVGAGATETDYGYTPAGDPSTDGGSGAQNYTFSIVISTGDVDVKVDVQLHRINSTGSVQSSSGFNGEQDGTTGTKTYTFSSLDLGTFASGDRLRVDIKRRGAHAHGGASITQDIGSAGTNLAAPWTITSSGPPAGLRTMSLTGVGI